MRLINEISLAQDFFLAGIATPVLADESFENVQGKSHHHEATHRLYIAQRLAPAGSKFCLRPNHRHHGSRRNCGGPHRRQRLHVYRYPLYTTITYGGIVSSVSGATISFAGTPFASMSFATVAIGSEQVPRFFLELTSGSNVGAMIPIVSSTASSVTLSQSASFIVANDTIKIRRSTPSTRCSPAGHL